MAIMKGIKCRALLFLLICFRPYVSAQPLNVPKKPNTRLKLDVKAPQNIQKSFVSYLSRELRLLGDIELVEENPHYLVSVLGIANESSNSRKAFGYTFSIVTLGVFPRASVSREPDNKLSEEDRTSLGTLYS